MSCKALTDELNKLQESRNDLLVSIDKLEQTRSADDPGVAERIDRLQRGLANTTEKIADVEGRYRDLQRAGFASGKLATEHGTDFSGASTCFRRDPQIHQDQRRQQDFTDRRRISSRMRPAVPGSEVARSPLGALFHSQQRPSPP